MSLQEDGKPSRRDDGPWLREYRGRELEFIRDVLGRKTRRSQNLSLWKFQRDLTEAFFRGESFAVGSARRSGKTFTVAGVLAPTAFATRPCRILMLSTGLDQVRDTLWPEFTQGYKSETHTLPGEVTKTRASIDPAHYVTAIPTKNPERVRGYHSGVDIPDDPDADELSVEDIEAIALDPSYAAVPLYLILDESQNIEAETHRALGGIQKASNVVTGHTGNTTLGIDDDHAYVHALRPGSRFKRFRVSTMSAEEEAALGIPPDPWLDDYHGFYRIPYYLSSEESLEEAIEQLGPMDSIFWADWLGRLLSGTTSNQAVPRMALETALAWFDQGLVRPDTGPRMGIDVSLGGGDRCVASLFYDQRKVAQESWTPGDDSPNSQMATARRIAQLSVQWGKMCGEEFEGWDGRPIEGARMSIDDTNGKGVSDYLGEKGIEMDRVVFSAAPQGHHRELTGSQRFANLRAEMYWCARRLLQTGNAVIEEKWNDSWQELPWTEFQRKSDGLGPVIQMEPKDEVKKRKKRSPDVADADVLALRQTTAPVHAIQAGRSMLSGTLTTNAGALNRRRKKGSKVGWRRIE